jgi:hypothetical protein
MDQFQIGERIWGTDRPFFLEVAHCLSKCTIPSGKCEAKDRSPMRY